MSAVLSRQLLRRDSNCPNNNPRGTVSRLTPTPPRLPPPCVLCWWSVGLIHGLKGRGSGSAVLCEAVLEVRGQGAEVRGGKDVDEG